MGSSLGREFIMKRIKNQLDTEFEASSNSSLLRATPQNAFNNRNSFVSRWFRELPHKSHKLYFLAINFIWWILLLLFFFVATSYKKKKSSFWKKPIVTVSRKLRRYFGQRNSGEKRNENRVRKSWFFDETGSANGRRNHFGARGGSENVRQIMISHKDTSGFSPYRFLH